MKDEMIITSAQLQDVVDKTVEATKEKLSKSVKPFGAPAIVEARYKEANPAFVGAYLKAQILASNAGMSVEKAAEQLMKTSKTFASEFVYKTINETTSADGGIWNIPEVSNSFADVLRGESILRKLPIGQFNTSSAAVDIYRNTAGLTTYWDTESITNVTATTPVFGKHQLVLKKLTAAYKVTKDMLADIGPAVENKVQTDLARAFAAEEDLKFLFGLGSSNEPKGMFNWIASGNKINATESTTETIETDLYSAMNKVIGANVVGPFFWVMPYRTYASYCQLLRATTGIVAFPSLTDAQPSLLGFPVIIDNNIPRVMSGTDLTGATDTCVFFMSASDFEVYDRAGIEFMINPPQTNITQYVGENLVVATKRMDCVLLHDVGASVIYGIAK